MIVNVQALPKSVFVSQIHQLQYSADTVLISILDTDAIPLFGSDTDRIITVKFSDITPGPFLRQRFMLEPHVKPCSSEDARKIVSFILRHAKDQLPKRLVVHCSAGISRSGAVASYAVVHSEMSDSSFLHHNPNLKPNDWVLWKLIEAQLELEE